MAKILAHIDLDEVDISAADDIPLLELFAKVKGQLQSRGIYGEPPPDFGGMCNEELKNAFAGARDHMLRRGLEEENEGTDVSTVLQALEGMPPAQLLRLFYGVRGQLLDKGQLPMASWWTDVDWSKLEPTVLESLLVECKDELYRRKMVPVVGPTKAEWTLLHGDCRVHAILMLRERYPSLSMLSAKAQIDYWLENGTPSVSPNEL